MQPAMRSSSASASRLLAQRLASGVFVKSKQVGSIYWDKRLDQETQRGPAGTWKDVTAMELAPIFVTLDAGSLLQVTGLAA